MRIKNHEFEIVLSDCVPEMERLKNEEKQFDLAFFSPPFSSLYAYTNSDADMGNSKDSDDEFLLHFTFFANPLYSLIKPGRNVIMHVQNPVRQLGKHGYMGIWDMRGEMIRIFEKAGFVYYGESTIWKNPQAQAIRTKSHALTFTSFEKDSARNRPALADYLLVFKKPGDNQIPVKSNLDRDDWIEWAAPIWKTEFEPEYLKYPKVLFDIKETNTLNTVAAREESDERHVCPLQLDLIEIVIRLWSNPGEVVFSPFAGIGSEGYISLLQNRRFYGIELKESYFNEMNKNLQKAIQRREEAKKQISIFDVLEKDAV
jgi:DNA modification methylase